MCTEKELIERLARTQKELEVFLEAISIINCSLDLKEILGRLMFLLHKIVTLGSCRILVMDKGEVVIEVDSHFAKEPCYSAFDTIAFSTQVNKVFEGGSSVKSRHTNWEYFIPMGSCREVQGVIHIVLEQGAQLDEYQEHLLLHLALQGAMVIKNAKLFEEVKRLATLDGLTGIYNRQFYQEVFPKEQARALRTGQTLSAIMVDVNSLKAVNDHYGHQEGDNLIEAAAQLIQASVRSHDYVFRYGGDELLALLVDAGSKEAKEVMERIEAAIQTWNLKANKPYHLSLSLGWASGSTQHELETLLTRADYSMYQYKQSFYQAQREGVTSGKGPFG